MRKLLKFSKRILPSILVAVLVEVNVIRRKRGRGIGLVTNIDCVKINTVACCVAGLNFCLMSIFSSRLIVSTAFCFLEHETRMPPM